MPHILRRTLQNIIIMISLARSWSDFPCSFTPDDVSQLDEDISTTLANIREWRNSFVHINRVPLDVLSLIPTHFDSQQDLLNASRVCRYWRRTFLQHAALWSRLYLSKGEACVRTFLERAKGSALDIITHCEDPVTTVSLLSPHTQRIRSLHVMRNFWMDVQGFSDINSRPLPLLHTLEINVVHGFGAATRANLSPLLFGGAANLKQLILSSQGSSPLSLFVFPNLTTFKLRTVPAREIFCASELLNFLEVSPTLQAVDMIIGHISLEDIAQRKAVVLPNVQTFSLTVEDCGPTYELIAHISCPSVTRTSLIHKKGLDFSDTIQDIQDMFPTAASWNTIVHQYTRSPIETATLHTKTPGGHFISCTLTFRSSDTTLVMLGFEITHIDLIYAEDESEMCWEEMVSEIFSQGFGVVRDHLLLSNIKHLHILNGPPVSKAGQQRYMADEVGELFKSMGPLEGLTLHGCDLYPYLLHFLTNLLDSEEMQQPITYPPIKELAILHPLININLEDCMGAIVKLARSQHALGVPFERVTVRAEGLPTEVAEVLRPWVGVADCCEEPYAPVENV